MNIDEWLDTLPDDERATLCVTDGRRAGAKAMQDALIDRGFISQDYEDMARAETQDIIG